MAFHLKVTTHPQEENLFNLLLVVIIDLCHSFIENSLFILNLFYLNIRFLDYKNLN